MVTSTSLAKLPTVMMSPSELKATLPSLAKSPFVVVWLCWQHHLPRQNPCWKHHQYSLAFPHQYRCLAHCLILRDGTPEVVGVEMGALSPSPTIVSGTSPASHGPAESQKSSQSGLGVRACRSVSSNEPTDQHQGLSGFF
jgi:hypothetical protein